jgi:hypothetical protein
MELRVPFVLVSVATVPAVASVPGNVSKLAMQNEKSTLSAYNLHPTCCRQLPGSSLQMSSIPGLGI